MDGGVVLPAWQMLCLAFRKPQSLLHVAPLLCFTSAIVLYLLWRVVGAFLGWYLRKKTDGRRCHILELVEADEKRYREERSSSSSSSGEDGEWEKVDTDSLGSAGNGDKCDDSWDGIVGFFHPFW